MTIIEPGKTFGFIVTTHITKELILSYVVVNLSSILEMYPEQRIILINDGSPLKNWEQLLFEGLEKKGVNYLMITIINVPSDSLKKGEINPYYYYPLFNKNDTMGYKYNSF